MGGQYQLEEIRGRHVLSDVVGRYVKLKRQGREYVGLSPFNQERSPSFTVCDDKGFYHDFSSGKHGDLFDFIMEMEKCNLGQACDILGGTRQPSGIAIIPRAKPAPDPVIIAAPVPDSHEPFKALTDIRSWNPKDGGKWATYHPDYVWPYHTADGELIGYVIRINMSEGRKLILPLRPAVWDGQVLWTTAHFDTPRPIYNLHAIPPSGHVLMVEGEKDADAATRMTGKTALAWPGGTNAVAYVDFRPVQGRSVVLWLDADEPGEKASRAAARKLMEAGASKVRIVPWDHGRSKGWGAADLEHEGGDFADVESIINTAVEYAPADEDEPDLLPDDVEIDDEAQPRFAFNVTFFEDIPDEHHKEWLIKDIMGVGEFIIVYGAPGCGKSVLMGDAAAHISAGLPWFSKKVKPCTVIYVAAERSALVKRRMAAFRKRHGIDGLPLVILDGLFNLATDPNHANEIRRIGDYAAAKTGLPLGLVIIDTKAQVMGGADENDTKDISILNNNIARIQQDGVGVIVVDHTPQADGKRMKGNGGLAGACDGSFLVQKEGAARTLSIGSKAPNDGPDDIALRFKLEGVLLGINSEGEETKAPVVVEAEPDELDPDALIPTKPSRMGKGQKSVIEALTRAKEQGRALGFNSIKSMTSIEDNGTLGQTLRVLVERGMIKEKGSEGSKTWEIP